MELIIFGLEMHTKSVRKSEGKRPWARPRHGWEDKQGGKVQTGFIWFRIGTSGRLFWPW